MKRKIAVLAILLSASSLAAIKGIPATEKDCAIFGAVAKLSTQLQRRGYDQKQTRSAILEATAQTPDAPVYMEQALQAAWALSTIFKDESVDEIQNLATFSCLRKN